MRNICPTTKTGLSLAYLELNFFSNYKLECVIYFNKFKVSRGLHVHGKLMRKNWLLFYLSPHVTCWWKSSSAFSFFEEKEPPACLILLFFACISVVESESERNAGYWIRGESRESNMNVVQEGILKGIYVGQLTLTHLIRNLLVRIRISPKKVENRSPVYIRTVYLCNRLCPKP